MADGAESTCAGCGETNPRRARFCLGCGAPLPGPAGPQGAERKLVTMLFCDLVGFTARFDGADPEDVRAVLDAYSSRVRAEVERFGGRVEKFIGDAVMAVFGVPVVREDDAERAVRAALAAVEAVRGMPVPRSGPPLAVRIGVNTGEVLFTPHARPERGETMVTGDPVNTAARLQGAAPVDGIVVGETTWLSTRHTLEYEELDAAAAKGKAVPLRLWRALGPRSRPRVGDASAPRLVGRTAELGVLATAFDDVVSARRGRMVLVTGEAGVGKSRLLREFAAHVDRRPELVRWREGRCSPHGEGGPFGALADVVRSHAGIQETDADADIRGKVRDVVAGVLPRPDTDWVAARLAPLSGIAAGGAETQPEAFAAWRRFLLAVARQTPLVLVVEDLHWASEALVAFLSGLVPELRAAPALLVATARPDARQAEDLSTADAVRVEVAPLTRAETAELLTGVVGRRALPRPVRDLVVERAGGNPLYVEELARALADRLGTGGTPVIPPTLRAVVGARLDTLAAPDKRVLSAAAVLGTTCWPAAAAQLLGEDEDAVDRALAVLTERRLLRRTSRRPAGYEFVHPVVREVAYASLPRGVRARWHEQAGRWFRAALAARAPDDPDALAHHYALAVELAAAAGEPVRPELVELAVRYLVHAGERLLDLDMPSASRTFRRALALGGGSDEDVARCWLGAGRAAWRLGELAESQEAYEAAAERARDPRLLGNALSHLGAVVSDRGDRDRARVLLRSAIEVLEPGGPSAALASAYCRMSFHLVLAGRLEEALPLVDRAVATATSAGSEVARAEALHDRGIARCTLGDAAGLADLADCVDARGAAAHTVGVGYLNLAEARWLAEGPAAGLRTLQAARDHARRYGFQTYEKEAAIRRLWLQFELGRWHGLRRRLDGMLAGFRAAATTYLSLTYEPLQALLQLHLGEVAGAERSIRAVLEETEGVDDAEVLVPALAIGATVAARADDVVLATERLERLAAAAVPGTGWYLQVHLPPAVRACAAVGRWDLATALVSVTTGDFRRSTLGRETAAALGAERSGNHRGAARRYDEVAGGWAAYGHVLEHGHALLGAARCQEALGSPTAGLARAQAHAVFARLGARPPGTGDDVARC